MVVESKEPGVRARARVGVRVEASIAASTCLHIVGESKEPGVRAGARARFRVEASVAASPG